MASTLSHFYLVLLIFLCGLSLARVGSKSIFNPADSTVQSQPVTLKFFHGIARYNHSDFIMFDFLLT